MNSGSGIQELMAAETRASQIVAEARIGQSGRRRREDGRGGGVACAREPWTRDGAPVHARGDRMKQAQTDADELIAAYRLEQQDAFDKAASASGGSGNNASQKLQVETNKDIQAMQGQFTKNAQKAVDVLLSKCCEVSLEVPTARIRSTQKLYGK
ncbi:hypothetical protein ACHAWF_009825 [Thalassiosira exigua]